MTAAVNNNAFELILTPNSNKRKRNVDHFSSVAEFTSGRKLPSSTPMANTVQPVNGYENRALNIAATSAFIPRRCNRNLAFSGDVCLEEKSIAELAANRSVVQPENLYEVVRKPPKKKKKHDPEESCFTNTALNLNAPEKPTVNPFEVQRVTEVTQDSHCFANPGLNLAVPDKSDSCNPYEVVRYDAVVDTKSFQGIENAGLDFNNQNKPTLAIAVPFTPTINRRIIFKDFSVNSLTPSEMLAKNLVFSPDHSATTPRRNTCPMSLSVISEEAVDIDEELDCYQLELENSINEAKMRKKNKRSSGRNLMDVKIKTNLSMRIQNEIESNEDAATPKIEEKSSNQNTEADDVLTPTTPATRHVNFQIVDEIKESSVSIDVDISVAKTEESEPTIEASVTNKTNDDVQFEEVDEEEESDLFKNPAPFQRAYRRPVMSRPVNSGNKNNESTTSEESEASVKSGKNFKDVIRRSIRRMLHPHGSDQQKRHKSVEELPTTEVENHGHGIMSSIRHSLRRRTKPKKSDKPASNICDVSLIDTSDRRFIFRDTTNTNTTSADATAEKQIKNVNHAMGGNSFLAAGGLLRRSTRDVKRRMMKTVFHKNIEDYQL